MEAEGDSTIYCRPFALQTPFLRLLHLVPRINYCFMYAAWGVV